MFLTCWSPRSVKTKRQPVAHLVVHFVGNEDAARLGEGFEPRRDVDPVAKDVAVLDDDVAEIDADAEFDAFGGRHRDVALGHPALQFDRAAHRVDDAGKLGEEAVAGRLDDAPVDVRRSSGRRALGDAR